MSERNKALMAKDVYTVLPSSEGSAETTKPEGELTAAMEAVRARSTACATAEAAKDIEGTLAFWAEDAVFQMPGAAQMRGREAIRGLYRIFFSEIKEFSGTTSHITVSRGGDLAFEHGVNRMVYPGPQGDLLDVGKYLLVWKWIGDDWYVAALSITSDAPAPVPLEAKA